MEKNIIVILGLIITYFLFRTMNRKQKSPTGAYSNILTNDKYKVKGQWDK